MGKLAIFPPSYPFYGCVILDSMSTAISMFVTLVGLFYRLPVKAWRRLVKEVGTVQLSIRQLKDPSQFVCLRIDNVEFNPKAYAKKEQDYLELSLSIQSGILADLHLDRLLGYLSIDGSQHTMKFEIFNDNNLVIHRTGQITEWKQIVVNLSREIQDSLHLRRQDGNEVVVSVNLHGYCSARKILDVNGSTAKLRVHKLPT